MGPHEQLNDADKVLRDSEKLLPNATPTMEGACLPIAPSSEVIVERDYPRAGDPEVTLEGNPEIGIVYHLAWHHGAQNNDKEELLHLGQRTLAILWRIQELGVQDCFLEGTSVSGPMYARNTARNELAAEFPSGELPHSLTNKQALLFAENMKSALVYFFPSITLHGTEPPPEVTVRADLPDVPQELRDELVFKARERYALQHIIQAFQPPERTGSKVALVYGASHTWSEEDLPDGVSTSQAPLIIKQRLSRGVIIIGRMSLARSITRSNS